MTAAGLLFTVGALLAVLAIWWAFVCWCTPGASEPMPPTTLADLEPSSSIDYRPSLLQARLTFGDVATSPRRNAAFLTDTQQAALMPCASELAARRAMQGMRVRMTGNRA